MRLSTFTDYSLRVLLFVATRPERRATIGEIAQAFDISENHLTKVVHFLAKAGWLASVRGRGGGLTLGRPAGEIVIGEVVRATEGPVRLAECFDPSVNECHITRVCELRNVLRNAADAFYRVLDSYTLAHMVGDGGSLRRVLFAPKKASAR